MCQFCENMFVQFLSREGQNIGRKIDVFSIFVPLGTEYDLFLPYITSLAGLVLWKNHIFYQYFVPNGTFQPVIRINNH